MKKYIKLGIIILCSLVLVVFTSLFFLLDFVFLFDSNKEDGISNFEVEGTIKVGKITTEIDAIVDGNKIKAEIGPMDFYV